MVSFVNIIIKVIIMKIITIFFIIIINHHHELLYMVIIVAIFIGKSYSHQEKGVKNYKLALTINILVH